MRMNSEEALGDGVHRAYQGSLQSDAGSHDSIGDAGWEKRFESMGIRKGRHMRKIASQPFGGPVVIEVNGSKISLGRILLQKSRWRYLPVPPVRVRPAPLLI